MLQFTFESMLPTLLQYTISVSAFICNFILHIPLDITVSHWPGLAASILVFFPQRSSSCKQLTTFQLEAISCCAKHVEKAQGSGSEIQMCESTKKGPPRKEMARSTVAG